MGDEGELGTGTIEERLPVNILNDVEKIGEYSAIKKDGSLWTWGYNIKGLVGDGTYIDKWEPVKIMSNVDNIYTEFNCRAATKQDGSLWMWGENESGQLGDGTTENSPVPKQVFIGNSSGGSIEDDTTKITVKFDAKKKGASLSTTSKKVSINQKYGTLPTPTLKNYLFKGWYTKNGAKVTKNTIVKSKKAHTLYAKWVAVTIKKSIKKGSKVDKGVYVSDWKLKESFPAIETGTNRRSELWGESKKETITTKANVSGGLSFGVVSAGLNLSQSKEEVKTLVSVAMQSKETSDAIGLFYRNRYHRYEYVYVMTYKNKKTKKVEKTVETKGTVDVPIRSIADDYTWAYGDIEPIKEKKLNNTTYSFDIPASNVYLNCNEITLTKPLLQTSGETYKLKGFVLPQTTNSKNLTWKSSNKKIVSVNSSGLITAKGIGSATITCMVKDNKKIKATCKVKVKKGVIRNWTDVFHCKYEISNKSSKNKVIYSRVTDPVLIRDAGEKYVYPEWFGKTVVNKMSFDIGAMIPIKELKLNFGVDYDWGKETEEFDVRGKVFDVGGTANVYGAAYQKEYYDAITYKLIETDPQGYKRESKHTLLIMPELSDSERRNSVVGKCKKKLSDLKPIMSQNEINDETGY